VTKKDKLPYSGFEYCNLTDEEMLPSVPSLVFQMNVQQSLPCTPRTS